MSVASIVDFFPKGGIVEDPGPEFSGPFAFDKGALVSVTGTARTGTVVARTEHLDDRHEYSVRFITPNGFVSRGWFNEIDLEVATKESANV